ncbi:dTDP-4-dehydrorhamnose reductase [Enterovibrio norvegicus]|uniref:dTDP-4-dehydrorhamnose reductase n=1 Tax=Enterovibrio norvegicus TaxID=188144 RepID=UPI0010BF0B2D|nr:dTDP-4-dehydrorhamnose reductase [Enterovibrio norvegicus]TKF10790.1 dTDP-4-dehydrorhamnose reductase [Enterovibrio norvegicus]
MNKVLITGDGGQLAWELGQTCPENICMVSLTAEQLDITDHAAVFAMIAKEQPQFVINAAAYTAVDKAETDQETAYAVNDKGSENLALACKEHNVTLVHVSTDFVFDGTKTTPYQPNDNTNPLNVYGASKLAGDLKVAEILGAQATIIRTAWVYSAHGNNFVKTMLRLMAEKEQLGIVYDQIGTPTWAKGLAKMIWAQIEAQGTSDKNQGKSDFLEPLSEATLSLASAATLLHWTDAGVASWYDFAVAIQELGIEKGLLDKAIPVRPIPASAYPTPAVRPSFSVIDKTTAEQASGVETIHWRKQLSAMMDELVTK